MLSIAAARCRRINRSIELIVQPAAKDAIGEMGVRSGSRSYSDSFRPKNSIERATLTCGVEVTKVHVETFYFPSPVTRAPEIYHSLRAVADRPTDINLRMTEGLGGN